MFKERRLRKEIIETGRKLYNLRLIVAKSGNLSARLKDNLILITATGTCLGRLKQEDIIKVDLNSPTQNQLKKVTSEFPLHSSIYKEFPVQKIIHCHAPLTNSYYSVYDSLENITFESKLFLGEVPVVVQNTPNVSEPQKVTEALKINNIVAIKNHGVVSVGESFDAAFYLIEELEETVKIAALARLFSKTTRDEFDNKLKEALKDSLKKYTMFSREHISRIADLISQDNDFSNKAKDAKLTTRVAIKMDGEDGRVFRFDFKEGRIEKVECSNDAPFVISGSASVWRPIFEGKMDPFAATTQGKLKLKGDMKELARWYLPFSRMFSLFKEVPIE